MSGIFNGQVVVVTGGSTGIGFQLQSCFWKVAPLLFM